MKSISKHNKSTKTNRYDQLKHKTLTIKIVGSTKTITQMYALTDNTSILFLQETITHFIFCFKV